MSSIKNNNNEDLSISVNSLLTLPIQPISEWCTEIKINLNFYFYTSLWCLWNFYEGLKGFHKPFEAPKRSMKIKIWLNFLSSFRIKIGRISNPNHCFLYQDRRKNKTSKEQTKSWITETEWELSLIFVLMLYSPSKIEYANFKLERTLTLLITKYLSSLPRRLESSIKIKINLRFLFSHIFTRPYRPS